MKLFHRISHIVPDSLFIKFFYFYHFKSFPNLRNPKLFNEKLQWLKLHDRKDLYTIMADKLLMKEFVTERIGAGHTVPTLQTWENVDEICLESLPEEFVLKCNHDSHSIRICRNKSEFQLETAKAFFRG